MILFRIVISLDGQVVKSVDIDDRQYFIGRGEDNDIILDNKKVSRSHAKLSVHGKMLIIEDLGSINGIYFDGRKVKKANLVTGDVVKILPYVFHIETVNMAIDEKPCLNRVRQSEETRQVTVYTQDGNTFNVELIPGKSKLGRSLDNEIIINDPSVSRWHAEITNTRDAVTVLDMASTSGTYIDGEKITSSRWLPGKTLNLGRVKLELSFVSTDVEEQLKSPIEIHEKPIVTLDEKHRKPGKITKVLAGVAILIFFISGWWVVGRYLLFNDKNVSNITERHQEKTALNEKQSAANIAIGKNQVVAKIENAQKIAEMEAKAKLLILLVDEAKKAIEAKKWRSAINSLRRALEISAGNQEVEKMLNYAKEAQAKKDKIALQKADEEHMKQSKYAESMSRYYSAVRGEKYSEAVQEAQKAIALYPNRREAQKALAKGKEYLAKQIQIKRKTQKQKNRIVSYAKKHYEEGLKFKKTREQHIGNERMEQTYQFGPSNDYALSK